MTLDPKGESELKWLICNLNHVILSGAKERIRHALENAIDLLSRLTEAEKLLTFYADESNWVNDVVDIGVGNQEIPETSQAAGDAGHAARNFLKGTKP